MLIFSKHAIQRALDMAVEPEEIQDAIHRPDRIGWSPKYGNELWTAGRVTLAVAEQGDDEVVVTILWSSERAWRDDYEIAPMPEGRKSRRTMFIPQ